MCVATVDCFEMEIHFPRDMIAHLVTLKSLCSDAVYRLQERHSVFTEIDYYWIPVFFSAFVCRK